MVIREAVANDLSQVLELLKELYKEELILDTIKTNYNKIINSSNIHLYVAAKNNTILGTCLVVICQTLAEKFLVIEDVVVSQDYRGSGIGHLLFEHIDSIAKEEQCSYSILVSSGFRKNAHRFYEQVGYTDSVRGFRKLYQQ